jgi:hypothetical protein
MESTQSILARRKIARIEKQISNLKDEAYEFWRAGNSCMCRIVEAKIPALERELIGLERMVE